MENDFYRILGVDPKASAREIKRAYLKVARREHPDVNPGDREAAARFVRIQEAWRVLSQRGLREEYDRRGRQTAVSGWGAAGRPRGTAVPGRRWERVLAEVFPEAAPPEPPRGPVRGEDVHLVLELTFEEAMRGVTRECVYQREGVCPACRGHRWAPGAAVETCGSCGGRGVVESPHGPWTVQRLCPVCAGEGEAGALPCETCRGRGRIPVVERRSVRVAAGSATGSRIVAAGWGQPGRRGGPPGDLLVTLKVATHPVLERRGQNLFATVPVSLAQAVLGGPVRVPTLEGHSTLRLPPGTQCGQQFALRSKGVPSPGGGKRGDLYVTVSVTIPSGEDPRVRRAMQELERAASPEPGRAAR